MSLMDNSRENTLALIQHVSLRKTSSPRIAFYIKYIILKAIIKQLVLVSVDSFRKRIAKSQQSKWTIYVYMFIFE